MSQLTPSRAPREGAPIPSARPSALLTLTSAALYALSGLISGLIGCDDSPEVEGSTPSAGEASAGGASAGGASAGEASAGEASAGASAGLMSGAEGGAAPVWDIQSFCERTITPVCDALFDCGCNPELRPYANAQDCAEQRVAACEAELNASPLAALLSDGRAEWVVASLNECERQIVALTSACLSDPPQACQRPVADAARLGEPCQSGDPGPPCAQGLGRCDEALRCVANPVAGDECPLGICGPADSCVYIDNAPRCLAPRAEGESCAQGEPCVEGAQCVGGRCALPVAEGGACEVTPHCAPGHMCEGGRCVSASTRGAPCSNERACASGEACLRDPGARVCGGGLPLGSECSFDTPCESSLRCVQDRCVALPALGEPCEATFECAGEAVCEQQQERMVCVRAPALGEPCLELGSRRCAVGLGCHLETGLCGEGGAEGELCYPTGGADPERCLPGLGCYFGQDGRNTCRPISARGGECTTDINCAPEDYCDLSALRCAARVGVEGACSAGNECAAGLSCQPGVGGVACRPLPAVGEACVWECAGGAVCEGVGGICEPVVCVN